MVINNPKKPNLLTLTLAGLVLSLGVTNCGKETKKLTNNPVTLQVDPAVKEAEKGLRGVQTAVKDAETAAADADKAYQSKVKEVSDKLTAIDAEADLNAEQKSAKKNEIVDSELKAVFEEGKTFCESAIAGLTKTNDSLDTVSESLENAKAKIGENAVIKTLSTEAEAAKASIEKQISDLKARIEAYQKGFNDVKNSVTPAPAAEPAPAPAAEPAPAPAAEPAPAPAAEPAPAPAQE